MIFPLCTHPQRAATVHGVHQLFASGPNGVKHPVSICESCGHFEVHHAAAPIEKALGFEGEGERLAKAKVTLPGASGPVERWITMHPHGKEERGYPVKIIENRDKSWTVAGGAKGVLNGLRLAHVKTPHQYRVLALQRRQEKAEKAQKAHGDQFAALKEKHAGQIAAENEAAGVSMEPHEAEALAHHRAGAEQKQQFAQGKGEIQQHHLVAKEAERDQIRAAAKAQGWDVPSELPAEVGQKVRDAARDRVLQQNPKLAAQLESPRAEVAGAAARKVNGLLDAAQGKVEDAYHRSLLTHAKAVQGNLRDQIGAAHDGASSILGDKPLGSAALSDVTPPPSYGDAGRGYARDVDGAGQGNGAPDPGGIEPEKPNAQAQADQGRERADKARAAAAQYQGILKEHGLDPDALHQSLNLAPRAKNVSEAAQTLVEMKKGEVRAKQAREAASGVRSQIEAQSGQEAGRSGLDTLPKTAVVRGEEMSDAQAQEAVVNDIHEDQRQSAVKGLLGLYNAQDGASPLVKHRLNGHNGFWGTLCGAVGLETPDPLQTDILGAAGSAHIVRRALEQKIKAQGDKGDLSAVTRALQEHHVEKQAQNAQGAVAHAQELLARAHELEAGVVQQPSDIHELLAGVGATEKAARLVAQAREGLGLAVGRLEAGAAMNEAMLGSGRYGDGVGPNGSRSAADAGEGDLQVALGALTRRDAHAQAGAVGLTVPDEISPDGHVLKMGQYRIVSDGHNQILCVHDAGVDALASSLHKTPEEAARAATMEAIKSGAQDEADWLPQGFSRRQIADVSPEPMTAMPRRSVSFDASSLPTGAEAMEQEFEARLRQHIGQCMDAGQNPLQIANKLNSAQFVEEHIPPHAQEAFHAAMQAVCPPLRLEDSKDAARETREHKAKIEALAKGYHEDFLKGEGSEGAVGSQSLFTGQDSPEGKDQDAKTRDALYQIALQDPRLPHAYTPVGDLGRDGRRAIRDYALQRVFGINDKNDRDAPGERLSGEELKAFKGWNQMKENAAAHGEDVYQTIQNHWKAADEGAVAPESLLLMDEAPQAHPFSTVDLNDDAAVLKAARENPAAIGLERKREHTQQKDGSYVSRDFVPELEVTPEQSEQRAASLARSRVKGALRTYAMGQMLGVKLDDNVRGGFNPDTVATKKDRWNNYVRDMGLGPSRAYAAIQSKMRGDVTSRLQKGVRDLGGPELKTVAVEVPNGDAHVRGAMGGRDRSEERSRTAVEQAAQRERNSGKFAQEGEGVVANKVEAARQGAALQNALISDDNDGAGVGESAQTLEKHRLSPGARVESQLEQEMPGILQGRSLRRGTTAARAQMSDGEEVKRQRAIKAAKATKRIGWALGTGLGKTGGALGLHGELRAANPLHRSLMVVPSNVQENFGTEAARFFDPSDPNFPNWHAKPGASAEERRAAYADPNIHMNVVTHQALRDDLIHALANSPATVARFHGDENKVRQFLHVAPEEERVQLMKDATHSLGWKHDLVALDEGQAMLNREGKVDSTMARAFDSFNRDKENFVSMSADPIKNDASEGFSQLQKIAPHRYVSDESPRAGQPGTITQSAFMRKYGQDTEAARTALAREMAPYQYAEKIDPKTPKDAAGHYEALPLSRRVHTLPLTPEQKQDYDGVDAAYRRLRWARRAGRDLDEGDIAAAKTLSPKRFAQAPAENHQELARQILPTLGAARDAAYDRVVNNHDSNVKMAMLDKMMGFNKDEKGELPHVDGIHPSKAPITIFARSLNAGDQIVEHLKKRGVRVAQVRGDMNGAVKEEARAAFSPAWDPQAGGGQGAYISTPTADVIVNSDAGAAGANLQRGVRAVDWDTPDTGLTYEQRLGRIYRTGQRGGDAGAVEEHAFVTDTPYERRRRENLERKRTLRSAVTTPHELIDDGGLKARLDHALQTQHEMPQGAPGQ